MKITNKQIENKALELIENGYYSLNHYGDDFATLLEMENDHIEEMMTYFKTDKFVEVNEKTIEEKALELIEDGYYSLNHYGDDFATLLEMEHDHIEEMMENFQ